MEYFLSHVEVDEILDYLWVQRYGQLLVLFQLVLVLFNGS